MVDNVMFLIVTDTVEMIQEVGKAAAAIVGLALISGIAVLVLVFLKKLAKPVCFASLTPVVLALLSSKCLFSLSNRERTAKVTSYNCIFVNRNGTLSTV